VTDPVVIREITHSEVSAVKPLLLLAEPSAQALEWSLAHMIDAIYRMDMDGRAVGAATVQWRNDPAEIIELAIAEEVQGRGLGRQLVQWLVGEARRRRKQKLIVGTANASLDNIRFYQRCDFRMDHVRRDYFWYYPQTQYENGIAVRDMLVFSVELT
jgi:GNAT superfamily N-acetyltransferase